MGNGRCSREAGSRNDDHQSHDQCGPMHARHATMEAALAVHDVLQSALSDIERPDAGEGEHRMQLPFQLQDVDQTLAIQPRVKAQAGDDLFVTTPFPFAAHLTVGPPHQRMEPPQEERQQLQPSERRFRPLEVTAGGRHGDVVASKKWCHGPRQTSVIAQ